MSPKTFASWSFVAASLLIGAGCGGSDAEPSTTAGTADDAAAEQAPADDSDAESSDGSDSSDDETAVGFGELMEGTFLFTGAEEQQFYVSDPELEFRLGGGCAEGQFGFSIATTSPGAETAYSSFNAQIADDLSGGVTGEFDTVIADVSFFPDGDFSLTTTYDGQLRMIISEHDTGGVTADLNARRMTVTLLGTLSGDEGDLDVDITFRWVMGCP